METVELKSHLHKIIDGIKNEQLLRFLYDFLKVKKDTEPGQLWASLTAKQKEEVLLSYEESEDDNNLKARNEVFE